MVSFNHYPMDVFEARALCDCGEELTFTGRVLACNPPLYVHECLVCEKQSNMDGSYPKMVYRSKS